jgi:hypothetical protein
MDNHEKRSRPRLPVNLDVFVRDRISGLLLGKLANIHEEGFMLIGSGDLREDALYPVRIEANELSLDAGVECLWTSETGSGDQRWAGFTFLDVAEADEAILRSLVKTFEPDPS